MAATDYDFILTKNELIGEAFRKIGVLADGQSLSGDQVSTASDKLNLIIKSWSDEGIHLWSLLTDTITTVAGTASYTIPTTNGMSYVDRAFIVENGSDLPLGRLSLYDYEEVYQKADAGKPYYFSPRPSEAKVYFYPVPNAVWTIKLWGIRPLKDWTDASSTGEFPSRWQNAIKYALAVDLGEDYKLPLKELQYLRTIAAGELGRARGKEVDRSDDSCVRGAY